jgi:hypothetical protein
MSVVVWPVIAIAVAVMSLVGYCVIGRWQAAEKTDDLREAEPELDARQEASTAANRAAAGSERTLLEE